MFSLVTKNQKTRARSPRVLFNSKTGLLVFNGPAVGVIGHPNPDVRYNVYYDNSTNKIGIGMVTSHKGRKLCRVGRTSKTRVISVKQLQGVILKSTQYKIERVDRECGVHFVLTPQG